MTLDLRALPPAGGKLADVYDEALDEAAWFGEAVDGAFHDAEHTLASLAAGPEYALFGALEVLVVDAEDHRGLLEVLDAPASPFHFQAVVMAAKVAFEALGTLAGLDVLDPRFARAEPARDSEDLDLLQPATERDNPRHEAVDDLSLPDVEAVSRWLTESHPLAGECERWLGGQRLDVNSARSFLLSAPLRRRHLIANALRIQSENLTGARDPVLTDETPYLERLATMTLDALAQVLRKLATPGGSLPYVRIALALPDARPGFSEHDAQILMGALAERTACWGFAHAWELVGRGHAGACAGLRAALQDSPREQALWVVGGVDSYFTPATLHALSLQRRLATPDARAGFAPGEGAGFVALTSERMRTQCKAASLAVLRGTDVAMEPARVLEGAVTRAQGLSEAILGACSRLRLPDETPELLVCDLNGERHRSEEWGLMQQRFGAQLPMSEYETPASYWGDVGAASIPLFVTLACRAFVREECSARRALVWASSDHGLRGAAVLERSSLATE